MQQGDGSYTNGTVPAFRGARITVGAGGTRTLRYKDGRTVTFTSDLGIFQAGVAIGVADANGNGLTLTRPYEQAFNIVSIRDATGRG